MATNVGDPQGGEPQGTPEPGPAPWASDLERFPEEVRGDVDSYLRETWQPRVTQLEQQAGQDYDFDPEEAQDALSYVQAFDQNPDEAFLATAQALYGEDALPAFVETLQDVYGLTEDQALDVAADQMPGVEPADDQEPPADDGPDPGTWAAEQLVQQQEDAAYEEAVDELANANPDYFPEATEQFDPVRELSVYVANNDGDLEAGWEDYKQVIDYWNSRQGVSPADVPEPEFPGTIENAGGGQPPSAPTQQPSASLGDATDGLLADLRSAKGGTAPPQL